MTVVDDGLTADQFRALPEHQQALDAFLKTATGAQFLFILNEGVKPTVKPLNFPQDRLEELHASEYRGLMGYQKCIDRIKDLRKPLIPAVENTEVDPKQLGAKRSEEELAKRAPKFELPAKADKTTQPTT
jgi:hypothetical protein